MTTTEARPRPRRGRAVRTGVTIAAVLLLLFGVPWWTLVLAPAWPLPVTVAATAVFLVALLAFPAGMFLGHARGNDTASTIGDTILGLVWIAFVWSIIGNVLRLALLGVDGAARIAAAAVAVVVVVLALWGHYEAMRVPRVREVEVRLPRLGAGLDGLRVVQITDTHYGPIDRARWSRGVTEAVNALDPDVVCHTGDIADGTADQRTEQSAPLGDIRATMARVYVTGNHEYYSGALGWLDRMRTLGWEILHNQHVVVTRDGASLVIAGVDDRTAEFSGIEDHHADHEAALAGADPALPVLLLAHQPKQIDGAVAHGIDLQLSGHTHGGQIWPFHYLVRTDQPVLQGLSRHGERTQLYTSRGTGFWGPPFRVFAPSEITLLTLRAG
ncbi:putative MPP superfamily phosphohydrolase [Spirilliplanes yamanashiensis]|nr:putative MPP superfamily phosphohydrolase [Spirilliplanes yamanashiensis]